MAAAQPRRDLALGSGSCCLDNLEEVHHTSAPRSKNKAGIEVTFVREAWLVSASLARMEATFASFEK